MTAADVESEVTAVLDAFSAACGRQDVDGVLALFAPGEDLVVFGSEAGETARGYNEFRYLLHRVFARAGGIAWTLAVVHDRCRGPDCLGRGRGARARARRTAGDRDPLPADRRSGTAGRPLALAPLPRLRARLTGHRPASLWADAGPAAGFVAGRVAATTTTATNPDQRLSRAGESRSGTGRERSRRSDW